MSVRLPARCWNTSRRINRASVTNPTTARTGSATTPIAALERQAADKSHLGTRTAYRGGQHLSIRCSENVFVSPDSTIGLLYSISGLHDSTSGLHDSTTKWNTSDADDCERLGAKQQLARAQRLEAVEPWVGFIGSASVGNCEPPQNTVVNGLLPAARIGKPAASHQQHGETIATGFVEARDAESVGSRSVDPYVILPIWRVASGDTGQTSTVPRSPSTAPSKRRSRRAARRLSRPS